MRNTLFLAVLALLAGCTAPVHLRNATTGQTTSCGPYLLEGLGQPASVADREARCIADFQRQGFERVP